MLSNKNIIAVSSAGSRKTTFIVEEALATQNERVLITTYTNESIAQIKAYLTARAGCIPPNITVQSWFSFLLQHGVRPYQPSMTNRKRIGTIDFTAVPQLYLQKADVDRYYLTSAGNILRDRVSDYICECHHRSSGMVINRLQQIYRKIFIDELQDLVGYDS